MFDKMKHMARTPMESENAGMSDGEPSYPFNLTMTLGNEEIEKLEIDCGDESCEVGNYIHMHVLAEIKGIHKTDIGTSLNLQVTHMCVENESEEDEEFDEEMSGVS